MAWRGRSSRNNQRQSLCANLLIDEKARAIHGRTKSQFSQPLRRMIAPRLHAGEMTFAR